QCRLVDWGPRSLPATCEPASNDGHNGAVQSTFRPTGYAWWCAGIRGSARQQEMREARPLYARSHSRHQVIALAFQVATCAKAEAAHRRGPRLLANRRLR